jgi:hypothetical protein
VITSIPFFSLEPISALLPFPIMPVKVVFPLVSSFVLKTFDVEAEPLRTECVDFLRSGSDLLLRYFVLENSFSSSIF